MTPKGESFTSAIFIQKATCILNIKKTKLKHITIPCRESIRLSGSYKAVFTNEKAFPSSQLFNPPPKKTESMLQCKCKRYLTCFRFFSGNLFATFLVMLAWIMDLVIK